MEKHGQNGCKEYAGYMTKQEGGSFGHHVPAGPKKGGELGSKMTLRNEQEGL